MISNKSYCGICGKEAAAILDARRVHEQLGITGKGIKVAVIDDGDVFGHQSAVISHILSTAPDAKIIPIQFMESFADSTKSAIAQDAQILNVSFGIPQPTENDKQILTEAINKHEIIVVSSVGNSTFFLPGVKHVEKCFPATDSRVICVGGAYYSLRDNILQASTLSLSGGDICGLAGMAEDNGRYILANTKPGSYIDYICSTQLNDGTTADDGLITSTLTSDSAAQVSGIVALMLEHDNNNSKGIKQRLEDSCIDITKGVNGSGDYAHKGRDRATGMGLVQAYDAVVRRGGR